MTAEEKLLLCRIILSKHYPFFSYLITFLQMEKADWLEIKTMATDGVKIFYDENFVKNCTVEELTFVLAHEVLHVALYHTKRCGLRQRMIWNMAIDFAVHCVLMTQVGRFLKPPKGILYNQKYDNMSAEDIYDDLVKNSTTVTNSFDSHMGPGDGPLKPMGENLEEAWRSRTYGAYHYAKRQGKLPGGLDRIFKQLTEPQIPWRSVLQNFVNHFSQDDFSWSRPNRHYIHKGLILPSAHAEAMGLFIAAIDTSGSVNEEQLTQMISELQAIRNSYEMDLKIIACDAKVHEVHDIPRHGFFDPKKLKLSGNGGTDFRPVFDYIKENRLRPTASIYMTDGYGSYPDKAPPFPTLWVMTKEHSKPPYGRSVFMNV